MELMEEIAAKHGLACLLHEKPFKGVNGSGKHNNFSLATDTGINLFNGPQLTKAANNSATFPVVMSAVVKAIHNHADLMRMSINAVGTSLCGRPDPSLPAEPRLLPEHLISSLLALTLAPDRHTRSPATNSASERWRLRPRSSRPTWARRSQNFSRQ